MKQNIYDNETFFKEYNNMRTTKKGISANDLIEIPTIRSMLPDLKNKKILELGCGYGENCSYFIEKGASFVLGTDISMNMINIAKENNSHEKIKYEVMAMEDISKLNIKFDLITSSLAVHYVEDFEKLLRDTSNLLNEGGYFIFSQEHPIGTGTILNEKCNGSDNVDIGSKNYYLVSNYNENGKRIVDWNNCKVIKFHRNFSYIINSIIKSDFEIVEFLEPTPNEEMLKIKPKCKNQFDKPYFLFVKLVKKQNNKINE